MEELIDEGYDIAKAEDGTYAISSVDEGALDIITQRLRIGNKGTQMNLYKVKTTMVVL